MNIVTFYILFKPSKKAVTFKNIYVYIYIYFWYKIMSNDQCISFYLLKRKKCMCLVRHTYMCFINVHRLF